MPFANINTCTVSGRLTRDPEVRRTDSDFAVATLSLAVNESRKNAKTGEWEDYANFIDCTVFGKRAESLAGILKKGTPVTVSGHLHVSYWERDGQKRSKVEVVAEKVEFPPQAKPAQAHTPTEAYYPTPF